MIVPIVELKLIHVHSHVLHEFVLMLFTYRRPDRTRC